MSIKDKASRAIQELKEDVKIARGEKSKDKTYESRRRFDDEASARSEFTRSRDRLFDVNAWSSIPAIANSKFELCNESAQPLARTRVAKGDFIRIDIPGPLPDFWVQVAAISEGEDFAEFVVQPVRDPSLNEDRHVTDHFFQDRARSIFRVERRGSEISAMEIGINEAINNKDDEAGGKGLVNTLVSAGGWAGFQKYQWKNLTDYLVGVKG